jgi:YHS domain-containing protein
MPPEAKPQPTEEEIATIEKWIAAGAEFDVAAAPAWSDSSKTATETASKTAEESAGASGTVPGVAAADPAAIEALRAKLVHVEPLARDSNLLIVSFAAVAPETDDAEALALLEPLRMQIADLSLARTKTGDETMKLAARMPNLSRLDVRETAATDAGVAALQGHAQLAELVLARTHLTDAAVDSLLALPALKKVFLWNSGVGVQGLARLRQQRADLAIEAGLASDARPIEKEKDVVLTKPAPAAGPAINTVCPVTGKPVDPANQIVFKGRVIGFCCPKCPDAFRADPAKYESKLP